MTRTSHLTRCATLALSATLALGSTPLLAQDVTAPPVTAEPPVTALVAAAPVTVAPPPTIIVPDVAPEPAATASAPAATTVLPDETTPAEAAASEEPAAATSRAATPARSTTARTPTMSAAAAPATETPDAIAATEDSTFVPPVVDEPLPAPELAPAVQDSRTGDNTLAIVLGVLAALALIVIGFFALRRKGPKRYAAAEPRIERPVTAPITARAEPLPEVAAAPAGPSVSYTGATFGAAAKPAGSLSHSGASVALPREMPRTYAEREALIRRMVEARPDRANPFRSKRARYRRARLILASLGREFRNTDPWIDLSQYPSNWPELARRQSVAA